MKKNVVFLLSHTPNPRIMKRARLLEEMSQKSSLIYAKRTKNINFIFDASVFKFACEIVYNNDNMLKRIISLVGFFRKSLRELNKITPSTIHFTNLDMLLCAYFYKKIYDENVNLIYEIADIPDAIIQNRESFKSKCINHIEKILSKRVNYLILTAEAYWTEYYSLFVDEKKYNFIPNKPEKKYFEYFKDSEIDINNVNIGFIGYVRYKKELEKLIDVIQFNERLNFIIAGDGYDVVELKEHSKDISKVKFLGKYNYSKEISSLYESIDIVYSAYDNENINCQLAIPNRLYEAIVCKKPIIVSSGTKLSEYVEKNDIGVSINPMEKESILNGINQIIDNYGRYKKNIESIDEKKWFDDYVDVIKKLYI